MFRDGDSERVRARFRSLRDEEAASAPSFRAVVARAEARRAAPRAWLAPILAVACAVALAAAAPFVLLDADHGEAAPAPTAAEAVPETPAPTPVEPEVKPVVATTPAPAPRRELKAVRQPSQNRNRSSRDCADC